jgi:hypothetical protein
MALFCSLLSLFAGMGQLAVANIECSHDRIALKLGADMLDQRHAFTLTGLYTSSTP